VAAGEPEIQHPPRQGQYDERHDGEAQRRFPFAQPGEVVLHAQNEEKGAERAGIGERRVAEPVAPASRFWLEFPQE
jgi:hypothetical protein